MINVTADNVVRLLPPLVMSEAEGRMVVERLAPLMRAVERDCPPPSPRAEAAVPVRHFLQFKDFSLDELEHVFARTRWIKDKFKRYERYWPLEDRTLAMIFEKPSTRTRMSFEAGMHQLGGAAIYLSRATRSSAAASRSRMPRAGDLAHVRRDHGAHLRTGDDRALRRPSRVPVINGLTNEYHPCQILADVFTYIEHRGAIRGRSVAWIGDSNNVCNTWLQAAAIFDFKLHISTPPGYEIEKERINRNCEVFADPMAPRAAPTWSPRTCGPRWASRPRTRSAGATSTTGRWTRK